MLCFSLENSQIKHRFHSDGFGIEYRCFIVERDSKCAEMIQMTYIYFFLFKMICCNLFSFIVLLFSVTNVLLHLVRRSTFCYWKMNIYKYYTCVCVWCMFDPKAICKQFCFALAMLICCVVQFFNINVEMCSDKKENQLKFTFIFIEILNRLIT